MDYLHGAYGKIQSVGTPVAEACRNAIVYVGTAPVHMVEGGSENVNKPILVRNISEARKYFGYSDNYADYTLCEAMHVHLELSGVAPLVLINVLDPAKHIAEESGTQSLTPQNGRVVMTDAENIIVDSITVKSGDDTKVKNTDYTVSYNAAKRTLTLAETLLGALGSSALTITYSLIDPSKVTEADVIGQSDGAGLNTGMFAVKNVYQLTGFIPSFLAAPGFSSLPAVHEYMVKNSQKINGHWDAYMFVDLPIVDDGEALTLTTAKQWKDAHRYNQPCETVYFPMATGIDGAHYHLSVIAAANFQTLLINQDGIPYKTPSNTNASIIQNLYIGESSIGRVYDDATINITLCKNGIASAAFVGGSWVIWGSHSADYDQENGDSINVSETNRMMLYHISNDFQHRRAIDVDKPLSTNDISSIISEEQERLDALLKIGALTYGKVLLNAERVNRSDIMKGDYAFTFNVTTMPTAKSLTAIVNWTDDGFVTYYEGYGA